MTASGRSSTKYLVIAAVWIVGLAILAVVALVLVTSRGTRDTGAKPFDAGSLRDVRTSLEQEGPYYVPDPFGGRRAIWFALQDGQVLALSAVMPGTDCAVNYRGSIRSFVDCHLRPVSIDELARYRTTVGTKPAGSLYVDLETLLPAPARATATTPPGT